MILAKSTIRLILPALLLTLFSASVADAQLIRILDPAPLTVEAGGDPELLAAITSWNMLQRRGDYFAIERDATHLLPLVRQRRGYAAHDVGVILAWLGKIAGWRGQREVSDRYRQVARLIFDAEGPPGLSAAAVMENNEAVALHALGDLRPAETRYLAALDIARSAPLSDQRIVLRIQENLALWNSYSRRWPQMRSLRREILIGWRRVAGDTAIETLDAQVELAVGLEASASSEAETLFRAALDRLAAKGPEAWRERTRAHREYAGFLFNRFRYDEAESQYSQLQQVLDTLSGVEDASIPGRRALLIGDQASLLVARGRLIEADPVMRDYVAREEALFGNTAGVALPLCSYADILLALGRAEEALHIYERASQLLEAGVGPNSFMLGRALAGQGDALAALGRPVEAESAMAKAHAIYLKDLGNQDALAATVAVSLAKLYWQNGKAQPARALLFDALEIQQRQLGPNDAGLVPALGALANFDLSAKRLDDGYLRALRAYELRRRVLGEQHPATNDSLALVARFDLAAGRPTEAATRLRVACASTTPSPSRDQGDIFEASGERLRSNCHRMLAMALWRAHGASNSTGFASFWSEAFESTQFAIQSVAGVAVSRAAAVAAASRSGAGSEAMAYETALQELDALDLQFARVAGGTSRMPNALSGAGSESPGVIAADLLRARRETLARIETTARTLSASAPDYWEYRAPRPVSLAELQGAPGHEGLLKPNEAVVVWLNGIGDEHGLVFAASRHGFTWAQIAMRGTEVNAAVAALRRPLDQPGAMGTSERQFPRQRAYQLHQALLGDPAIQAIVRSGIDTLIIVPTGSLTRLSPAMLVTAPPAGEDGNPKSLRETAWLVKEKALAVLPALSSLKTLRSRNRQTTIFNRPLTAFAAPDFAGTGFTAGLVGESSLGSPTLPQAEELIRGGRTVAERLADLPSLYWTLQEAKALADVLKADPARDLFVGPAATETKVRTLNAEGRFAESRVIAFATHGLLSGEFTGLTEPALALANPATGAHPEEDDGLLRASEVAGLRIRADWVLLSACNTAGGNAEGLSGLARAFFRAGASALFVSHWRVSDETTSRFVPLIFGNQEAGVTISKAKAVQRAMLSLIEDTSRDAQRDRTLAHPRVWAPFTLVGDPS